MFKRINQINLYVIALVTLVETRKLVLYLQDNARECIECRAIDVDFLLRVTVTFVCQYGDREISAVDDPIS